VIVATAGHVDHGKTVLIKALTGVDTDRLPEEKARGLSIELGFAYHDLGGDQVVGFIDVPGHERFVRNMLSGVAGVDLALLVVAADDGPMPQTEEHLAILDLLGISNGLVALTKIDRVPEARVAEVTAQIEAMLLDTSLEGSPIHPVSGQTGDGVPQLRDALKQAAEHASARTPTGNFRLAVDRSFVLDGVGRVVTGTVFSGQAALGETLTLSPKGTEVRVRGIHALNQEAEQALAGQRCAINITGSGLRNTEISRGDWLVAPAAHGPVDRLDARIRVLSSEPKPFKHWTPVHVHLGAAHAEGRIAVLDGRSIAPGETNLVQIVLDTEIAAARGDRLILRDQSARRTVAGGMVIDPYSPKRGRARPDRLVTLGAMEKPEAGAALGDLLANAPDGVDLGQFSRAWNMTPDETEALFGQVPMAVIDSSSGPVGLRTERWRELHDTVVATVRQWHGDKPESLGPNEQELRKALPEKVTPWVYGAAVQALTQSNDLLRNGVVLHLPGHTPQRNEAEVAMQQRVADLLEESGLKPPVVRALADSLGLDHVELGGFLKRAAQKGFVVKVTDNRFFLPEAVRELALMAEEIAAKASDGVFTASDFRDRSSIGRNITIDVLEYFDRAGFTHRTGNDRRIKKPAAEVFGKSDG
jgi:selenocysteine-specific elongation factor